MLNHITVSQNFILYYDFMGVLWWYCRNGLAKKSQTYKYFQILSQHKLGCSLILSWRLTHNKSLYYENPFHKRNIDFKLSLVAFFFLQTLDLGHSINYFNLWTSRNYVGGSWLEQLSWVESFFHTALCSWSIQYGKTTAE